MKINHLVALLTALVAVGYGLSRYTYGLFVPEMRATLGLGMTAIGAVASVGHAGYIAAILACMVFSNRLSPRTLMLAGTACAVGGIGLMVSATSAWVLGAGAFVASMSAGFIWTAAPDAVSQLVNYQQANAVLGRTNAGASVGVLVAAPIALFIPGWRIAYAVYALLSMAALVWAWHALPPMTTNAGQQAARLRWNWLISSQSAPLLGMAVATGLIAAVYWTFAVDLIASAGLNAPWVARTFWFVSGAAGVLAAGIAGVIDRYGVRQVVPVNVTVLALALGLLAAFPTNLVAVMMSAVAFGLGFITITGTLAIWSVRVFAGRPSAGMGAVLIIVAVGQVVGPVIAGALAAAFGMIPVFYGGAALALLSMGLRPAPSDDLRGVPAAA